MVLCSSPSLALVAGLSAALDPHNRACSSVHIPAHASPVACSGMDLIDPIMETLRGL
jgi:hypothetical protein